MPRGVPTEPVLVNDRPGAVLALAASPWAPLVAIGQHKQVLLYNTQHQYLAAVFPFPEGDVRTLKFTRDGDLLLAGGGVLLLAAVWAVFRSESDAIVEVPTGVRIAIEVAVFAAATAALVAAGRPRLAIAFAVVAAVNEILNYTLH